MKKTKYTNEKFIGKYYDHSSDFKFKSYKTRQQEVKDLKEAKIYGKDCFYVYAYLDPRNKGEYRYGTFIFEYAPFYIGKGKEVKDFSYRRLFDHLYYSPRMANKHLKYNVIERIKQKTNRLPIIIKLIEHVSEETAYRLECDLIKMIGRIENGTGILTNKQSGHRTEWDKYFDKNYRDNKKL